MGTKYDNADWKRSARTYGVTQAIIGFPDTPNTVQGNYGVSLPCRGCWVQKRENTLPTIKMSIGTPASAVFGVELGDADSWTEEESAVPLWVPVSDVNQLHFYGTDGTTIDIMYLLG